MAGQVPCDPWMTHVSGPNARFGDLAQACSGRPPADMVEAWYVKLGIQQAGQREARRNAVATLDQWRLQRDELKQTFQQALGRPVVPKVEVVPCGQVEKKDIVIHKLLFSSMEDHWVTANLYLPRQRKPGEKLPAIISACGHAELGKGSFGQRGAMLALNGYAVLIFDPVGQGERRVLFPAAATVQHNCIGSRLVLAGCNLGWFLIQDNMAAVTLLQQHPAIDPQRIGMTGSSGGGWLTIHAGAMDERIGVLAPAASVRAYRNTVRSDDAEQTLFDMQRQGLDFPDLMGFLVCPRPVFIVANQRDIWPIDQTRYAHDQAMRFYQMHQQPQRFQMRQWDRGHVYEPDQLACAVRWFNTWLRQDPDRPVVEQVSPDNLMNEPESHVTATGRLYQEKNLPTPNRFFWRTFQHPRNAPRPQPRKKDVRELIDDWHTVMAQDRPASVRWVEVSPFALGYGVTGRRIACQPTDGIALPVDMAAGPSPTHVLLRVDSNDRRQHLANMVRHVAAGAAVYHADLRGWGETSPVDDWPDRESLASSFYSGKQRRLHALALMTGRQLVLDRANDLLAVVELARQLSPGLEIHIHASRGAVVPALVAALVDGGIAGLTLVEYLQSFREAMGHDTPLLDGSSFIHGLLAHGLDMDDLLQAYPGRLNLHRPHDAMLRPVGSADEALSHACFGSDAHLTDPVKGTQP